MRTLVCVAALGLPSHAIAQGFDAKKASEGEQVYENYCFTCHGEKLRSTGQTFDLRKLKASERERFDRSVRQGKGQMPPWAGVLSDEEIDQIWHFIRQNADDRG